MMAKSPDDRSLRRQVTGRLGAESGSATGDQHNLAFNCFAHDEPSRTPSSMSRNPRPKITTERYSTSVPEWDRQFRLVRVHHEHREKLGRLRLAGIGADAVAVTG